MSSLTPITTFPTSETYSETFSDIIWVASHMPFIYLKSLYLVSNCVWIWLASFPKTPACPRLCPARRTCYSTESFHSWGLYLDRLAPLGSVRIQCRKHGITCHSRLIVGQPELQEQTSMQCCAPKPMTLEEPLSQRNIGTQGQVCGVHPH